jgi:hypothetical protein
MARPPKRGRTKGEDKMEMEEILTPNIEYFPGTMKIFETRKELYDRLYPTRFIGRDAIYYFGETKAKEDIVIKLERLK